MSHFANTETVTLTLTVTVQCMSVSASSSGRVHSQHVPLTHIDNDMYKMLSWGFINYLYLIKHPLNSHH